MDRDQLVNTPKGELSVNKDRALMKKPSLMALVMKFLLQKCEKKVPNVPVILHWGILL